MLRCPDRSARQSASSCIRKLKHPAFGSTASLPIPSSTRSRRARPRPRAADENPQLRSSCVSFHFFVRFIPLPGKQREFGGDLLRVAEPTRAEIGGPLDDV